MNLYDKLNQPVETLSIASLGELAHGLFKLVPLIETLVEARNYLLSESFRGTGDRIVAQTALDDAWEKVEQWLREAQRTPRHPLIEGLRGSLTNVLYDNTSSPQEREAEVESVLDLISHKLGSKLPDGPCKT